MNQQRSLDELTASELNDAIDDTNFPKAQSTTCLSGRSNSTEAACKDRAITHQNGNHTPVIPAVNNLNGNEDNASEHSNDEKATPELNTVNNVQNGHTGFIKRTHPAPLKMVAFKADSIDVPGTPRTPRTSTTPGK